MRSKIIAAAVAGGLLVGAGLVTSLVSAPPVASAQEEEPAAEGGLIHRGMELLSVVLTGLVDDGTIDQSQADAVTAAVEDKAEEVRAQRGETRELIRGFLEDGVIAADELAQLPDDHPFNDPDGPFAEAAADGELTIEEIREARPHPRWDAFKRGVRFGALLDDGGIDTEEYESLPDEHPLKQIDVSEYLEDGVITVDELHEILDDWRSLHASDDPEA
jgi:hypothetical protein